MDRASPAAGGRWPGPGINGVINVVIKVATSRGRLGTRMARRAARGRASRVSPGGRSTANLGKANLLLANPLSANLLSVDLLLVNLGTANLPMRNLNMRDPSM